MHEAGYGSHLLLVDLVKRIGNLRNACDHRRTERSLARWIQIL